MIDKDNNDDESVEDINNDNFSLNYSLEKLNIEDNHDLN